MRWRSAWSTASGPTPTRCVEQALALATQIAQKSPLAIAGSKRALNFARDHGVPESLDHMAQMQSAIFDIGEMGRAIQAWQSKTVAAFEPLAKA